MAFQKNLPIKQIILGIVAVLALLLAMTGWGRRFAAAVLSPFVGTANWATEGLGTAVRALQPGRMTKTAEIHTLKARIEELQTILAGTDDLRRQNEELRRAAKLSPPTQWHAVLTEVISRDPERWDERMMVGGGTEEGIVVGAAALVDGLVIGRVLHVHRHSAEIVTILSEECRFGVALANSDAVGVLQGLGMRRWMDGQPGFLVDYLPKDIAVQRGHPIVTSGLGGWMPSGLPVGTAVADPATGTVLQIQDSAYGQLRGAPSRPLGTFHFVTIMVPLPPSSQP
ncbi:MAG: rod shape-determining protein MreC [Victivallales bacterium]|nr:rod shape-determining protein MreC [Victivallales bacterium]